MLCFRCGSPVVDTATSCANCGQDLKGSLRPDPASFSELQKRLRQTGREWTRPSAYQIGEVVRDRYEIKDIVGEGGLGTVYKVLDQEVEVEVALKVIAPEVLPDDAARIKCLEGLQPLRDLVHENVVRTFDVDRDGERCFYVMQFLEGLTLRKIMKLRREKGQRFGVEEVEPIYSQLCRALGDSSRRMAHGGVKPENIIILPDLLKITDFGLAAALPRAAYLAAQRASEEAWSYVAPEIREGAVYDSRADVYSVGVILIELLTGARWEEWRSAEVIEGLPLAFARALQRAVDADPGHRQLHPGELGDNLAAAVGGKPARATQAFGSRANPDLAKTREIPRREETTREIENPDEPTSPRSVGSLEEGLPEPDILVPDAVSEAETSAPRVREGSGLTHQLDIDDIEFASQRAKVGGASEDELLLRPGGDHDLLAGPDASAGEHTDKIARAEIVGAAGRQGIESGVIEGTQQISADMIIPHEEEEPAAVLVEPEDQDTGRVRRVSDDMIAQVVVPGGAAAAAKPRAEREARARDALQAFDFEATLDDKVEAAGRVAPATEDEPVPAIEEASAPFKLIEPQSSRAEPATGQASSTVAPEVLGRDAVPQPLQESVDVTQSVPRPLPAPKGKTLPVAVLSFVLVLIAGTGAVVYWIHRSNQDAAQAELERKRILDEQALAKRRADSRAAPVAIRAPDAEAIKVEPAAAKQQPEEPKQAKEPKQPKQPRQPRQPKEPKQPKELKVAKVDAKREPKEPKQPKQPRQPREPKEPAEPKQPKELKVAKAALKKEAKEPAGEGEKRCPAGMRYLGSGDEGFCIDRYEYPGRGQVPAHGVSVGAARTSCKARGQRLCTAKEWLRSCGSLFPYGKVYDPAACNTGQEGAVPSGSKKGCRSRFGVYDLSGNVSEWVEEGVAMGGDAKSEQGHASCPARSAGGPLTGFRCCADPEWE